MDRLIADLRFALRRARKRVGFTIIAVLSLALGIGANTAIFSLVNAILLRRAPIPQRERVAEIYQKQADFPFAPFSYPDYLSLKQASDGLFSQISVSQFGLVPRDMGDHVESLTGELVNGDYFPLLGLTPHLGRLLGKEDDVAQGAHPVVVLAYDYWQRAYAADPNVVGREMRIGGRAYTIVGVAPRAYVGMVPGLTPALFAPIQMVNQLQPDASDQLAMRGNHGNFIKVRLAPGVSMAQVRALAASFATEMKRSFPKYWPPHNDVAVVPETAVAVNPMLDSVVVPAAAALMVVVGLVLLVACANLASFLLAQARDRQREIAIRLAIGASRRALVRQLLVESLLLSTIGGAAGVLLSRFALDGLLNANLPVPLPIHLDVGLDARILVFAIVASAAAGVLFGLLPALQATRPAVIDTIKNENTGGGPAGRWTVRNFLVVGEVAVSLLLLIAAALFLRSLEAFASVDPGFGKKPAGMVWMTIPPDRFDSTRRLLLLDDIERRMRAIPGVEAVGVIDNIMLNALNQQDRSVNVDGFTPPKGLLGFPVDAASADSGFFDAAGAPILSGRPFNSMDVAGRPRVAVINEEMARMFWPGREAVGRDFRIDTASYRVIGVMRTTKVRSLGEAPRPFVVTSFRQEFSPILNVIASTRGDGDRAALDMVSTLRAIDPTLMVIQAKTLQRHLATMVLPARLGAIAFSLFAALALGLAVIGVYGVVSYAVSRRVREVGIRLAIGAQPNAVVRLLMREGIVLVALGGGLGLVLGLGIARALQSLLYGVGTLDPVTFIGAPLLLLGVGALACFIPALRASRVDPARVLHGD